MRERSDEELVALFQREPDSAAGREAVSHLFRRYRDAVYLWCHRHLGDHDEALDLAQETFIEAHRALPGFEGRSAFRSWLFAIARFRCLSAIRRRRSWFDDEYDLDLAESGQAGPEEELLEAVDEDRVLAFLERHLDETERTAFWLRCYEDIGVDEITRRLGVTDTSGARGVLQRARRKLRAALAREDLDGRPLRA